MKPASTIFYYILGILLGNVSSASAQSQAGLTKVKDTSFTNYSAFLQVQKLDPFSSLVEVQKSTDLQEYYDIPYQVYGKRVLKLDLFKSSQQTQRKNIAIIMVHGGGWRSGDKSQHHQMAIVLANRGYVCITPEYRLSTEALYPAAILDVKSAVVWAKAHASEYNIDSNKIIIAGFSAGAQIATLVGVTADLPLFDSAFSKRNISTKVRAIINIDGIVAFMHPLSGEGDDSKKTSAATNWFGYSKTEKPSIWQQASPLNYASKKSPPTLFINSSVERMHAGRDEFMRILDDNRIYTAKYTFEEAPHSFCLFNPWFKRTIDIMDKFLTQIFPLK